MTQNTRAERLRKLIADEDEANTMPFYHLPKTGKALELFLERLHQHETSRRYNLHDPMRCILCTTADDMIKEFS